MSKRRKVHRKPSLNAEKEAKQRIKTQSTMEYMMTWGWAILVIAIVAGVLYSFGIFNPSSSISNTVSGFSGLNVVQNCVGGNLVMSITNPSAETMDISGINATGASDSSYAGFYVSLGPDSSGTLMVPNACPSTAGSSYYDSVTIDYTEPGYVFGSKMISTGKVTGKVSTAHAYSGLFAAYFNGANGFINISSIPLHNGSFTITAFVYGQNFVNNSNASVIVSQASSSCPGFYHCIRGYVQNDTLTFGIIGSDKPGRIPLNDGQWYLTSFVYNESASNKVLYLNQSMDAEGPSNKPYSVVNGDTLLGAFFNKSYTFDMFHGVMMNVQVYNTSLTQSQILSIYNRSLSGVPPSTNNLIAWWPLDGNALDYSGNHYNGVPVNVTFVPAPQI